MTLKKVSARCALFRTLLIHTFPQQCLEGRRKEVKEEAEELTLLQKMRAMQQNIRGGEKGKSPRNNIVRKTRKETRMKKEDQEGMSKMRKILERVGGSKLTSRRLRSPRKEMTRTCQILTNLR